MTAKVFFQWRLKPSRLIMVSALLSFIFNAHADINIGVVVSATGAGASLGIPERQTIELMPKTMAGQKVNYFILDDASDTTQAITNTRKLISENKVDVIIGSTISPNSLGMTEVVAEAKVPMISMAGSAHIVEPVEGKKKWVFKTTQNDFMMSMAIANHMEKQGVKTVAFIGFSDSYGENWYQDFAKAIDIKKIKLLGNERFGRTDTSVTGQILKLLAAKPDAILIGASGTPAALPQKTLKDRGYKGLIYQTHGVANNDFLRVGGKDVENTVLPAGPMLVADQLPDQHPAKKTAQNYVQTYEAKHGKGSASTFGGHAWDAGILIEKAIPEALKKGQAGTAEFRTALRDALENSKEVAGAHGIFNMSPNDHSGLDSRAVVMIKIENGKWKYQAQ